MTANTNFAIWNALTMMVRGYGLEYVKREVKKNPKDFYKNLKQMARAFPEFSKKPKNYKFNEASLTIPQYKTSIKKLSHSQQDKLFDLLHKLKLMKLIDFINYRDGSLHIAKSSITPKIKKAIERKFKIRLKESTAAVNLDKEKNDERYPEQPNFNFDPEKGKTRIRKIRK